MAQRERHSVDLSDEQKGCALVLVRAVATAAAEMQNAAARLVSAERHRDTFLASVAAAAPPGASLGFELAPDGTVASAYWEA